MYFGLCGSECDIKVIEMSSTNVLSNGINCCGRKFSNITELLNKN